ncbi:WD40/YVTN/BNR-like repeat-containing protein [Pandoraea terrae]|uniref:WD40/YVTN/BNR-like repeat-containing protein n=1 Tax=Pandoraea terrae TaxID=1537710 RepID=UPI001CD2B3F6|nr:YCF48-related protein [Pandoraea terrae]
MLCCASTLLWSQTPVKQEAGDPLRLPGVRVRTAADAPILAVAARESLVLAVGLRGVILRSEDGGASFASVEEPVGVDLTGVVIVGHERAFAVGQRGVVLRSDDAGRHWRMVLDGPHVKSLIGAQGQAANPSGSDLAAQSASRVDTWPLFDADFVDMNHGVVAGAFGLLLRTEDGGETWQDVSATLGDASASHLYGLRSVDGALFLVGERGLIRWRPSGSPRFQPLTSPYRGSWFGLATGQGTLLVFGMRGNAYTSRDGGRSWRPLKTGTQASLVVGLLLDDGSPVLVAQNGEVLWGEAGADSLQRLQAPALPYTSAAVAVGRDGRRKLVLGALSGGLKVLPLPAKPASTHSTKP